ncbi:MAG: GPW/gp25 family protein [Sediminibacterium sp.]
MAFEIKKINPLDRQPRKAVGVSLPFTGRAVFNSTYQTRDAVKNNLINYFLTGKGERYLNPTFGSGLPSQLFEQITEESLIDLRMTIVQELRNFFPKVVVKDLVLESTPDSNLITFYLKYDILDSNIEDEVVINIER